MAAIIKKVPLLIVQTKVGYVAIYKGDSYGAREMTSDDNILYEDRNECLNESKDEKDFVAVAAVEWEEPI